MSGTPGERESRDDVPPFAFVVERPIDEKPSDRARCPYCGGNSLSFGGATHTLIGGGDGTRDGDPNHWHERWTCGCGKSFQRETRAGQVWYTADGEVLAGFPNCYESYTYHHVGCGKRVTRRYTKQDGETPAQALGDYRTFFDCECGETIERTR